MRPLRRLLVSSLLSVTFVPSLLLPAAEPTSATALAWPAINRENKPWTRWWWPGSGVDKASLTAQLEKFAAAGIGGVEITPIYGAKGYEDRYIDFLSPKWMEMLEHVGREAKRLDLGVDMATGTGWPFGGPWIDEAHANTKAVLRGGRIVGEPTKQMVKRAAPGDEGLVVDPYSPDALRKYLVPFDKAFANFPRGLIRGQFHDSFEYYGASWTAQLPEVFRAMHGYDIQTYAAALLAKPGDPALAALDRDTLARIKSDYRNTLAKLHLDYLRTWVEWSHAHGFIVRNQSHGAPGNLLDLYANADIPETEIFGSTPFPIPGLRRDPADIANNSQDLPESLVIRMASSAAHVAGRPLASSESLTWLRDHFKESPSHMKPELDRIFCDGINHVFYHGTVFSPQDAPWPGWLFYAATQFNPNNPLWEDLGQLNRYIARVQSVLQRGQPDNDILLYWPADDIWDNADGLQNQLTVHNVKWLTEQPVGKLARSLMDQGYTFDYISDAQLQQTHKEWHGIVPRGGMTFPAYRIIVVPATRRMPEATLKKLAEHAANGTKIIFGKIPDDVPGYGRLSERRTEFKSTLGAIGSKAVVSADILAAVAPFARREALADAGLSFIRRTGEPGSRGYNYFVANLTSKPFDGWINLAGTKGAFARISDPLTGLSGLALFREDKVDVPSIYLQLAPGESLIVTLFSPADHPDGPAWPYRQLAGKPAVLSGKWSLTFFKGGPDLPPALETTALKSWTDLGGDEAKRFAGTARYRLEFDAPAAKADDWLLDLGDVRETARVRLNGTDLGLAWSLPFQLRFDGALLKPTGNILELDVTNLAANRIRDLDQRKVDWKIMREINFVNINYRPFDASGWAFTPSGLLGPVTLTPLRAFTP